MTIPFTAPGTSESLHRSGRNLFSSDQGTFYPILHDVPVLLARDARPTHEAAFRSQQIVDSSDAWQIDTLGISEALRERVRQVVKSESRYDIDPVVNFLISDTNGNAYKSSRGKLKSYPIPQLPLPRGDGKCILDIGCNWGRWCVSAAQLGYDVYGVDPSLGAVLAAKRVFRQLRLNGNFACGDGRSLPFPGQSFDVVYSYSVLQHFSDADAEATWAEIARVLKPNGLALIQMANRFGVRSMYHQCRRGFRKPERFEVRYRAPESLRDFGNRHVGSTKVVIDCFGGLGLQYSDRHLYGWAARCAVTVSESLKRLSGFVPPIKFFADSLFVCSVKTGANGSSRLDA